MVYVKREIRVMERASYFMHTRILNIKHLTRGRDTDLSNESDS